VRELQEAAEIPAFLLALRQKTAEFAGLAEGRLQHALVTEYAPGAAIGWHRDRPEFEDVIGISLGAPCGKQRPWASFFGTSLTGLG
jgi:alkylated DNA repair dioxygenase AlkB